MHKQTIIFSIITFILGYSLSSFIITPNNESPSAPETIKQSEEVKTASYFENNLICNEMKAKINQKLKAKNSPFGKSELEQIFYSPEYDTCLYVEYSKQQINEMESFYNRRLFNINDDSPASNPIDACLDFVFDRECDALNRTINDLKVVDEMGL